MLADVLRDRLQQVRLAEPGAAVDEERVVGLRRRLGDGERGRVGEPVRRADHERGRRCTSGSARPSAAAERRGCSTAASAPAPVLAHRELDAALLAGRVAHGGLDQAEEVVLDPLAREVVRDARS